MSTERVSRLTIWPTVREYPTDRGLDGRYEPIGIVGLMDVDPQLGRLGVHVALGNGGYHHDLREGVRRAYGPNYPETTAPSLSSFSIDSRPRVSNPQFMISGSLAPSGESIDILLAEMDASTVTPISEQALDAYSPREVGAAVRLAGVALCTVLSLYRPHQGGVESLLPQSLSVDELEQLHADRALGHGQLASH